MAKSRKEASREKKIYKINTKYTIYKQTKQRYNNNPTPPPSKKKERKKGKERKGKERKGKERKGKKKKSFSRNQTQHILFVGKLVTAIPLTDEQPIFVH